MVQFVGQFVVPASIFERPTINDAFFIVGAISTVIGIFLVPGFYVLVMRLVRRITGRTA